MSKNTKYTKEILETAVENTFSYAGVLRYLGLRQAGGTQSYISSRIKGFSIDTSHFTGQAHNKGKASNNRLSPSQILVIMPKGSLRQRHSRLKRAMIESGIDYTCAECGMSNIWNGKIICLEVDHIDGDWLNNLLENLRFLCPNCHSQQTQTNRSHKLARLGE